MGLLRDVRAVGLAGREVNQLAGSLNAAEGQYFESLVFANLAALQNTTKFTGATRRDAVNTVPDLPVGLQFGVSEIKNVLDVAQDAQDAQIQAQISIARQNRLPYNLIISPRTRTISEPLRREVDRTGGKIWRFNPDTSTWDIPVININQMQP